LVALRADARCVHASEGGLASPKLDAFMRAKEGVQALAVQPDFEDAKRNLATALGKR